MKRLIGIFFGIVLLFLFEAVFFMCWHAEIYSHFSVSECLQALTHSIPQDLTMASYLMVLPLLLSLLHIWLPGKWLGKSLKWYLMLMSIPLLAIFLIDLVLFGYWQFRIDATPLIYLLDNPAEVLKQGSWWMYLLLVLLVGGFAVVVWRFAGWLYGKETVCSDIRRKTSASLVGILLGGVLFLCIRGGVSESTMNIGRAYFSNEQMLNQAAVNPAFSFFYSLTRQKDYSQMYRFMSKDECARAMKSLYAETVANDTIGNQSLLNTPRPNILIVILEGFSGKAVHALYPEEQNEDIMPTINRLYSEGIGWTRFYANSWRTDRGVASILAAYPAQPTTTVMKEQSKCNHLNFLPKALKQNGYSLEFIYGGDINFTNMQGFLRAGGVEKVVSMADFPLSDKKQEWGVPDERMYDFAYDEMVSASSPFCKMLLTLSSHEPWDVPDFNRFPENEKANAFAYADDCLGKFLNRLKTNEKLWSNLLVVILPDHCSEYPKMELQEPDRYHIPMVWTGGAIKGPRTIAALGQQTDLAATLLHQLGISHDEFVFSKDLMSPSSPRFAFYDFPDGFGLLTDSLCYVQNNQQDGKPLKWSHDDEGKAQRWGKAYLQNIFDDLSNR